MKKKLYYILITLLCIPSVAFAEETISNGTVSSPIGTVISYAGATVPEGYLEANGACISQETYANLYAVLKNTYGTCDDAADGTKLFRLPNLQGRTAVGTSTTDSDFSLGKTGGEKSVTLSVSQMPEHTHTFTGTATTSSVESNSHTHIFSGTTSEAGVHTHGFTNGASLALATGSAMTEALLPSNTGLATPGDFLKSFYVGSTALTSAGAHTHTFSGTTSTASTEHTHTFTAAGTNASTGGSQAHNNMQPYLALKYIIKWK